MWIAIAVMIAWLGAVWLRIFVFPEKIALPRVPLTGRLTGKVWGRGRAFTHSPRPRAVPAAKPPRGLLVDQSQAASLREALSALIRRDVDPYDL